ncbi:unnamed protein product [Closterium sp. Yama58-4]|nr:unnamed protein product [Closterium sp. Yama58-4]
MGHKRASGGLDELRYATSYVADLRRPFVARRLSDGVAQPAAASPPGDVKLAPSQLAALVALTGWEAVEMCSQWMGVTCDGQGMVTKIEFQELISAGTLTPPGRLPADIAAFTALQVLNLAGQNLSGPIPMDAFRNLAALQELDLSSNPLTGSLEFLCFLPFLQYLDLHGTGLTGEIPTALGKATALSYLSLAYINLTTAELPASLSALTNLAHLDLSYLKVTSVPSWIARLPHLQFLDVTAPDGLTPARSSPFPAEWTALTSLNTLRAAGNGLSGSLPATISALTGLSELDLSHNALVGSLPLLPSSLILLSLNHNALEGPFSASPAAPQLLEVMQLSHNRFTWPTPASLSGLAALVILDVSYNDLSGPIPPSLTNLSALVNVDISHNALSGGLDVLARMTNISTLNIGSCNLSGAFPTPLAQLALADLDISNNSFTGPFPSAMLSAPQYKRLNLSANNFSGPLPAQLTSLSTLNSLDISHNHFTGVVSPAVFTLPSLTAL